MNVVGIKLKNILGISECSIKPDGNIIEVSGKNGVGKTSLCEGVKDALNISEYSSLLRDGEEKGEVVLDLGDMLITKKHTEKGSTLNVKGRVAGTDSMSTISSPAKVLKSLINPDSVDRSIIYLFSEIIC